MFFLYKKGLHGSFTHQIWNVANALLKISSKFFLCYHSVKSKSGFPGERERNPVRRSLILFYPKKCGIRLESQTTKTGCKTIAKSMTIKKILRPPHPPAIGRQTKFTDDSTEISKSEKFSTKKSGVANQKRDKNRADKDCSSLNLEKKFFGRNAQKVGLKNSVPKNYTEGKTPCTAR